MGDKTNVANAQQATENNAENTVVNADNTTTIKLTSKLKAITIFDDEDGDTCSIYLSDEFAAFKQNESGEYVRTKRPDFSMYFKQFVRVLPELEVLYHLNASESGVHDNKRDERMYRSILVGASITIKRTFVPKHEDAESGETIRDQFHTEVVDIKLSPIGNKMLEKFTDKAIEAQYGL